MNKENPESKNNRLEKLLFLTGGVLAAASSIGIITQVEPSVATDLLAMRQEAIASFTINAGIITGVSLINFISLYRRLPNLVIASGGVVALVSGFILTDAARAFGTHGVEMAAATKIIWASSIMELLCGGLMISSILLKSHLFKTHFHKSI